MSLPILFLVLLVLPTLISPDKIRIVERASCQWVKQPAFSPNSFGFQIDGLFFYLLYGNVVLEIRANDVDKLTGTLVVVSAGVM